MMWLIMPISLKRPILVATTIKSIGIKKIVKEGAKKKVLAPFLLGIFRSIFNKNKYIREL